MKVLVLDDDHLRHRSFARRFKKHEVTHTYSPLEAASLMSRTQYDLVTLDHDLRFRCPIREVPANFFGGYVEDSSEVVEVKGSHLTAWMTQMPVRLRPSQVVIHSLNSIGNPIMRENLYRAGFDVRSEGFENDRSDQGWFYVYRVLHEPGGPCVGCDLGYPKACDGCGGLEHAELQHLQGDLPTIFFKCEDCQLTRQCLEELNDSGKM